MEDLMDDLYGRVPEGTEWCPEWQRLRHVALRGDRALHALRGKRLVMIADPAEAEPNGHDPARQGQQD
jgi:hypothetical protein